MKIVLFGPPGVGKGTQAKLISEKFNIKHISTGDILRTEISNQTDLGKKAKSIIESGQLVPDNIMIDIIRNVLSSNSCKSGFILDGFPRTTAQAEALDKLLEEFNYELDAVIYIDVSEVEIINRLSKRYTCSNCGKIFNLETNKIKNLNCTACFGKLIQRDDDKPETVISRLRVYKESTQPVKRFYEARGKLHIIDGSGSVENVANNIFSKLEK